MCTNIAASAKVIGSARAQAGWVRVDEATISFDHATHLWTDHALRLDLRGAGDPFAVELDLASAKALVMALSRVIEAAEAS